jgi:hypothetical protein
MTLKREIEIGCENSAGDWHASIRLDCQAMAAHQERIVGACLERVCARETQHNTERVHSYILASVGGRACAGRLNLQIKLIGLAPPSQINLRFTIIISCLLCLLNK